MDVQKFWNAVLRQDAGALAAYFAEDAWVNWHNTGEHFTAAEFIRANCEYPGSWAGEVERTIDLPGETITVTHVYDKEKTMSFHVVSFIRVKDDKIQSIDEYWGDDGEPPQWRKEMRIGTPIREG